MHVRMLPYGQNSSDLGGKVAIQVGKQSYMWNSRQTGEKVGVKVLKFVGLTTAYGLLLSNSEKGQYKCFLVVTITAVYITGFQWERWEDARGCDGRTGSKFIGGCS